VDLLFTPIPIRETLGETASESLVMMFADAHKLATESFERRLEVESSKTRLAIADLRFELLKWLFLFWVGQLAAVTGILLSIVKQARYARSTRRSQTPDTDLIEGLLQGRQQQLHHLHVLRIGG